MGKDKKKQEKKKKGSGKEKTEAKTLKNAAKKAARNKKDDDEDIDALLAQIAKKEEEKVAVTVEPCDPPSARANCTFTAHPTKEAEVIMFGGEYFNGILTMVYNDLFRFNIEKNQWLLITSPNSPPPRSSHQCITYRNFLYIFGGEFTSPKQTQFYHYRDFWRLDLTTNRWEHLNFKDGPSARSGHRMVRWKNRIVLFGGFYDTGYEVKYYNDLHIFELDIGRWVKVAEPKAQAGLLSPSPRSACQLAVYGDEVFLYGGYFKQPVGKGGEDARGVVHTDMWSLNMNTLKWTKTKRSGVPPGARSGFSLATHKKKAILFGGVRDEDTGENLSSTFYNDLYGFQMDNRRWFPMPLRKKKGVGAVRKRKGKKGQAAASGADGGDGEDEMEEEASEGGRNVFVYNDEEIELYDDWDRWLAETADDVWDGYDDDDSSETTVETVTDGVHDCSLQKPLASSAMDTDATAAPADDSNAAPTTTADVTPTNDVVTMPDSDASVPAAAGDADDQASAVARATTEEEEDVRMPLPRINASVLVQGNTLYIFGGIMEVGDREITLDDLWALDITKLDQWRCLVESNAPSQLWVEEKDSDDEEDQRPARKVEEEDDDEEDEEEDDDEDDEDDEEEEGEAAGGGAVPTNRRTRTEILRERLGGASEDHKTPRIRETLKEFFARTGEFWCLHVYAIANDPSMRQKQLRADAFAAAQARYEEVKPILAELEALTRAEAQELGTADTGHGKSAGAAKVTSRHK